MPVEEAAVLEGANEPCELVPKGTLAWLGMPGRVGGLELTAAMPVECGEETDRVKCSWPERFGGGEGPW